MSFITRSITPNTFFATQLPLLRELFYSTFQQYSDAIPLLGNVRTVSQWGYQTTEQYGLDPLQQTPEGAPVNYSETQQGYKKTFTVNKWSLGARVTLEMIDDDQFDQVQDIYRSMGRNAFNLRQVEFFNNFNDGFSLVGYDGVPWFSTSHPLKQGFGTQANKPAVDQDLSVTSLQEALTAVANWVDPTGNKILLNMKHLLVAPQNIYNAHELVKSEYKPNTANNNVSPFTMYGLEYMQSPYLTDSNAWFLGAEKIDTGLFWVERSAPAMQSFPDFDNYAIKSRIDTRFDTGIARYIGWWGNQGS